MKGNYFDFTRVLLPGTYSVSTAGKVSEAAELRQLGTALSYMLTSANNGERVDVGSWKYDVRFVGILSGEADHARAFIRVFLVRYEGSGTISRTESAEMDNDAAILDAANNGNFSFEKLGDIKLNHISHAVLSGPTYSFVATGRKVFNVTKQAKRHNDLYNRPRLDDIPKLGLVAVLYTDTNNSIPIDPIVIEQVKYRLVPKRNI